MFGNRGHGRVRGAASVLHAGRASSSTSKRWCPQPPLFRCQRPKHPFPFCPRRLLCRRQSPGARSCGRSSSPEPQPEVERLAGAETWILEGNYGGTMEIRLARADTIVFLDFPRWRCIGRVLRRVWRFRGRSRPDLAPGCPERLDAEFLLWLWRFPRRSRPRVVELIGRHRPGRRIEILRSPRDVRRFLGAVSSRLR